MKDRIIIRNRIEDIGVVSEKIENLGEDFELEMQTLFAINLSLDEILTNIISYAYQDEDEHNIEINIELCDDAVTVQISDDGIAFDPLKNPPPNTELDLEERDIGGLGIHFVKEKMDEVSYRRENEKNILTIKKIRR